MEKIQHLYVLWENEESQIRYVGISVDAGKRFNSHKSTAIQPNNHDYRTYKSNWLRKCLENNTRIGYTIIGTFATRTEACAKEIEMIATYKQLGFKLTNISLGGEGVLGVPCSDTTREKLREKMRYLRKGKKHTQEAKDKMRKQKLGIKKSPEAVEKTRQSNIGRRLTSEQRERISRNLQGRPVSPETRERIRQANLGKVFSTERIEAIKQGLKKHRENKKDQAIA